MTVIADSEVGASGRYINLGKPSAHNDLASHTVMVYARPTAAGGGNFGYMLGKTPSGSNGVRMFYGHNGGAPRLTAGMISSSTAAPLKNTLNNSVVYNTWQNYCLVVSGATIGGSATPASVITLYIDKVSQTTTADEDGIGTLTADASYDLFLMNRGDSGTLGREFVGDIAYIARWNRALNSTEIANAVDNGPLSEPSGLILCWANGQDYSTLALTPTARSTRVAGSAPPNTALGGAGDTTAPVLSSPTGTQTGSTTGTGGATTDEANGTFYSVASTSSTAPTGAQVEAGQMHTGSAAAASANTAVSSTGAKSVNFTGLSPSTLYYAHSMHKDAAGNRSNVVTSSSFTTTSGATPRAALLMRMIGRNNNV